MPKETPSPTRKAPSSSRPPKVPLSIEVKVFNQQRAHAISVSTLRHVTEAIVNAMGYTGEVTIIFLSEKAMTELNGQFLHHKGSTDVITFDHGSSKDKLNGEIYISPSDAAKQSIDFKTPWSEEIHRYIIHGLLHLAGFDDLDPAPRRVMKRHEKRWLQWIIRHARKG